jgi:hypothetical protein
MGCDCRRQQGRTAWVQEPSILVHDNWYQLAQVSINWFRCRLIRVVDGFGAVPLSPVVAQSSRSAADPSSPRLLPPSPSLWAPPMEASMSHTPVNKIGVNVALALLDELKPMLTKMVAAEEAKRAALPAPLPSSPSLDTLRSTLPSFPPPRQAIFKRGALPAWNEGNLHRPSMAG